jgi:hypothetical protein
MPRKSSHKHSQIQATACTLTCDLTMHAVRQSHEASQNGNSSEALALACFSAPAPPPPPTHTHKHTDTQTHRHTDTQTHTPHTHTHTHTHELVHGRRHAQLPPQSISRSPLSLYISKIADIRGETSLLGPRFLAIYDVLRRRGAWLAQPPAHFAAAFFMASRVHICDPPKGLRASRTRRPSQRQPAHPGHDAADRFLPARGRLPSRTCAAVRCACMGH